MKTMITRLVIPLFALLLSPLLCVANSTAGSEYDESALASSVDASVFANAAPAAPLNDAERAALGQRAYRRSCVHCHGIMPKTLAHQDAMLFLRTVLNGRDDMPALGFKISAREVDTMRFYLAQCATNTLVC